MGIRKLFCVVNVETIIIDENSKERACTGFVNINVYTAEDNTLIKFFDLNITEEQDVEKEIQNYLNDNGYGDEVFEFKYL